MMKLKCPYCNSIGPFIVIAASIRVVNEGGEIDQASDALCLNAVAKAKAGDPFVIETTSGADCGKCGKSARFNWYDVDHAWQLVRV